MSQKKIRISGTGCALADFLKLDSMVALEMTKQRNFACSNLGGIYIESYKGEKISKIQDFLTGYKLQTGKI